MGGTKETTTKSVAVIIVNWNGLSDTIECVESLLTLTFPSVNIIVVDNGSTVDETPVLRDLFGEKIHVVRADKNKGYSAGVNCGLKYVDSHLIGSDYILVSNNDVTFDSRFLDNIVSVMETNPSVGIACGKLLISGTKNILYSIGQSWNLKTGSVKNNGYGLLDSISSDIRKVDFVSGAAFVIKRLVIKKVGLLDEGYFLFFEEPDYCMRAKKMGFSSVMVPLSIAFHKSASSTKKVQTFAYFCYKRSHLRFITKHFTGIFYPFAFVLTSSYIGVYGLASSMKHKDPKLSIFALKAVYCALMTAKKDRFASLLEKYAV